MRPTITESTSLRPASGSLGSACFRHPGGHTRGKKHALTAAGVHALWDEYNRAIEPARALAAETVNLERTVSDLVNQAYGLTPAEIDLMWKTAPPRMPIPPPTT